MVCGVVSNVLMFSAWLWQLSVVHFHQHNAPSGRNIPPPTFLKFDDMGTCNFSKDLKKIVTCFKTQPCLSIYLQIS